ncbi:hypothetical protein D3872_14280 [Massilia cavernae]|uniref:Uncharacterized protein n=2 Tax=Massilia cavernae TaxID=2320864 RepID=A0A418XRY8_9BURK|nr:hypothetical protein D3872_14280 [Massilia cavernae]
MMSDTARDELRRLTALELRVNALFQQMATKADLAARETERSETDYLRSKHKFDLIMAVCITAMVTFGLSMAAFSFVMHVMLP